MAITPDTRDWTAVLTHPCDECGFDATRLAYDEIPDFTRKSTEFWVQMLERDETLLRQRPDDATWAPLEYAAHVRDVHRIMLSRLNLVLVLDDPLFANWQQDATAEAQGYLDQDPARVAVELAAAGEAIAAAFGLVPVQDRGRTGRRSDGARFTVETLAQYFWHDVSHHVWDVTGRAA